MSDDWQVRKDIDRFSRFLDNLETTLQLKYGVSDLADMWARFYDVSEVDDFLDKFREDLDDFQEDLEDLGYDLKELDNSLNILMQYLYEFEGDLTDFDEYIQSKVSPEVYNKLNKDIISLMGAITTVKKGVSDTEDSIAEVNNDIENNIVPDINGAKTRITTAEANMGNVYLNNCGNLQHQIFTIIASLESLFPMCPEVESLPTWNGKKSARGNYLVPPDYTYTTVYDKSSSKYYKIRFYQ